MTNWAYGITVCLTITSGIAMLMASNAETAERQAVQQRQIFDQLTETVETESWELSDLARAYVINKNPDVLQEYRQQARSLTTIEHRLEKLKDRGATPQELMLLREGLQIADELQDEQQAALASIERGADSEALTLLYGKPYEQELERVQTQIDHFRLMLEGRAASAIAQATEKSHTWRTLSEIMVALTALMFLFVLGFILQRRVLYPVVRLSDVVQRLASQDYAVEAPSSRRSMRLAIWPRRSVFSAKMAWRVSVLSKSGMPTGRFGNCWRA
jgi:CHASE3 domain sensor protein